MLRIVWDCHGVLLDFARPLLELHGLEQQQINSILNDEYVDRSLGLGGEFWKPLERLPEDQQVRWWSQLPIGPLMCTRKALAEKLLGIMPLSQLVATSPGSPPDCRPWEVAGTTQAILRWLGTMPSVLDRKGMLNWCDAVLVDDHDEQIDYWRATGRPALLVPGPKNSRRDQWGSWSTRDFIHEITATWLELGMLTERQVETIRSRCEETQL